MKPRVFIAETTCRDFVAAIRSLGWGRMFCQRAITPFDGEVWGFDNGAFLRWRQGLPFDDTAFLARVEKAMRFHHPSVAVVPDIVGRAESLDFSLSWMSRLPHEWPWYLAAQDGMPQEAVGQALPAFAGLFLGGTDRFKLTAYHWSCLAHAQGKKFHYARAGTPTKLRHAAKVLADSIDTAFPLWTKDRFRQFANLWQREDTQGELAFL